MKKKKEIEQLSPIKIRDYEKLYVSGVVLAGSSENDIQHFYLRSKEYIILSVDYLSGNKIKNGDIEWRCSNGYSEEILDTNNKELTFKIIPERCGKIKYTISARLKDQPELQVQKIILSGWVPQDQLAITEVEWSIPSDNKQGKDSKSRTVIEPHQAIQLDVPLTLKLNVQGLNGYKLTIELWAEQEDAVMAKNKILLTRKHDVLVVDGVAVTDIGTRRWDSYISKQKNYNVHVKAYVLYQEDLKQKDKEDRQIQDTSGRGPLRIEGSRKIANPVQVADSLTKSTVSQNESEMQEFTGCTFDRVDLRREGYPEFVIFDKQKYKGKPVRTSNRIYKYETAVLFDLDSSDLKPEFYSILDGIAEFLELNPTTTVKISGHTDLRESDDYNMTLGAYRTAAVYNYLKDKKVDSSRLSSTTLGKRDPFYSGEKVTDLEHYLDRKVILSYEIRERLDDIIIYNLVSTTALKPIHYRIEIEGYRNKGCIRVDDPEHAHQPIFTIDKEDIHIEEAVLNIIDFSLSAQKVKTNDVLIDQIISIGEHYRFVKSYLDKFKKLYLCHLHACYPFSDVTQPTFEIAVYPDTLITYDFRYKYDDTAPFTFNPELNITLYEGGLSMDYISQSLDKKIEFVMPALGLFFSTKTLEWVLKTVKNTVVDFIRGHLDDFQFGIHLFQDFIDKDNPQTKSDELADRQRWVSARAEMYNFAILIANIILLAITRGKNGFSENTAKRIQQYKKLRDKKRYLEASLDEKHQIEIKQRGIAECSTLGYEQQEDGRVDYIYRYKAAANPLLGIEKKFWEIGLQKSFNDPYSSTAEDVRDDEFAGLQDSILESALKSILPVDAYIKFGLEGVISFEYQTVYNYSQQTFELFDIAGNKNVPPSKSGYINFQGYIGILLHVKVLNEYEISWLPFVGTVTTQVDEELKITAGITLQLRYVTDPKGPCLETILGFTGIEGRYIGKVKTKNSDKKGLGTTQKKEPSQKPIYFKLFPGKNFTLYTKYL